MSKEGAPHCIVVGGGLAGLTAACELLERGCHVTILEKHTRLGGVSSKAVTGIAAPGCELQEKQQIPDKADDLHVLNETDPAAKDLIQSGSAAVDWLCKAHALQDELVLRVSPGHSTVKRTLSTKDHFPGMVITYGVAENLARIAQNPSNNLRIVFEATVTGLVTEGGTVTGVDYFYNGKAERETGKVILCTGGFAGDKAQKSILAQNRADLISAKYPKTADERACGDGIELGKKFCKAKVDGLNDVQLTPLAVVDPEDPDNDWKMCLSSTFLGAGATLLDSKGERFCDELGPVQDIVDKMASASKPFRLVIPQEWTYELQWLADFYNKKGFAKYYHKPADCAKEMGGGVKKIEMKKGEDGQECDGPLYCFEVTAALYTCAGGLATDHTNGKVIGENGSTVKGLFAAGETTSCPFKKLWSVAGIPLLWAIHSGRKAGEAAAKEALMGKELERKGLASLIVKSMFTKPPAEPEKEIKDDKPLDSMSKEELIALAKKLREAGPGPAAVADGPDLSEEEVAKHNTKEDAWVIINGQVCDVTKWIPVHPGGEQAIMAYVGKDATEEWNMIHKPGTVEKNAAPANGGNGPVVLGPVGKGGPVGPAKPAAGGITWDEVRKHKTKEDAWVVINGMAIDVTKWIPIHPGGEAAIMGFLGEDASTDWNGIHRPGTVEKNEGPNVVIKGPVEGGSVAPPPVLDAGEDIPPPPEGNGGIPTPFGALFFMLKNLIIQLLMTVIPFNWKFKIDNNRNGTIRSACFLLLFTIGHSGGNFLDIIAGPNSVNGEGYMFDRFHNMYNPMNQKWTKWTFSLVDIYLYLSLLLHVTVALKRSWDISMAYCVHTGKWNMMISGLTILFFLINHLWDLQFYDYHGKWGWAQLRVPNMYVGGVLPVPVNPPGMAEIPPAVFFSNDKTVPFKQVRDLYSREVDLFSDLGVCLFYTFSLLVFVLHMMWGWKKLVPADAMQVPKDHVKWVTIYGQLAAFAIGCMYLATPWAIYLSPPGGPHPEAYTNWPQAWAAADGR